jgi:argininosuccinate lyase
MGGTLARVAGDLAIWYGSHGALALPDELVGASSLMPQKRNPFLLEHVVGKAARVSGNLSAVLTANACAPFANSVQLGTEATEVIVDGLGDARDALALLALTIEHVYPIGDAFAAIGRKVGIAATGLALQLRMSGRLSFREAHHAIGAAMNETGSDDPAADVASALRLDSIAAADPAMLRYGGGSGGEAPSRRAEERAARLGELQARFSHYEAEWGGAQLALQSAIETVIGRRD